MKNLEVVEQINVNMNRKQRYKIAVAGIGYVGLSLAVLLAQHHHVTAVDLLQEKVNLINQRKSPIRDDYIEKYLAEKELDLQAVTDGTEAYREADFIIVAVPTNYDSARNFFLTHLRLRLFLRLSCS